MAEKKTTQEIFADSKVNEESKVIDEPNSGGTGEKEIAGDVAMGNSQNSLNVPIDKHTVNESLNTETDIGLITEDAIDQVESVQESGTLSEKSSQRNPNPEINDEMTKIEIGTSKSIGSLGLLCQYASSSDEDSRSDDSSDSEPSDDDTANESESSKKSEGTITTAENKYETAKNILNKVLSRENYRAIDLDTSEFDSDDSDVEYDESEPANPIDITNDEELHRFMDSCGKTTAQGPVKAKGELCLDDLPRIAELTITVSESECVELGSVFGIVDTLVLVESQPKFAAVDIDTVLFLNKGNTTLGQVFDVMGNVSAPMYCVRFNSSQDIQNKNITIGLKVYVAPQTEYTNFIVLSNLMSQKGCDASWENDHEVPDECNDFSDDDEERMARRKKTQKQRNKNRTSESDHHLPEKVQIKSEPSTSNENSNRRNKPRSNRFGPDMNKTNSATKFYKDNRGYNNSHNNYYQQPTQPHQYNYSWHTAAIRGMTPPVPSNVNTPESSHMQYMAPNPNFYPNPFALQNAMYPMNFGPFSLQSFPPLPPPTNSLPIQYTRQPYKNSRSSQKQ